MKLPPHTLAAILSGQDRSLPAHLLRAAAACAEPLYRAAVNRRNAAYDRRRLTIHHAPLPVISIGNITTGGTGKTPMVALLVQFLLAQNLHPVVLMRGYGSAASPSDEQLLLAQLLPSVPIIANPNRVHAAAEIPRHHPSANLIILDDGFQHRRLHRDLDLLLLDAANPFGFNRLLPRGLLREPLPSLARAHAVIITHAESVSPDQLLHLQSLVAQYHGSPPLAVFQHQWSALLDSTDHPVHPARRTVLPVCAIANPAPFLQRARDHFNTLDPCIFPDHHLYSSADLQRLAARLQNQRADAILTTEKDWVKMRNVIESARIDVPVWRAQLSLVAVSGLADLHQLLFDQLSALVAK